MKTTSRFALAAAAGLFMGAVAFTPAKAADLGGDCCADLEERVAELEATTARKGNRVVSLQIYGQVNQALLIWDDGFDSDAYVVDNDWSMTRLGVRGSATMKPGWSAGYNIELGLRGSAPSSAVSQGVDDPAGVNNIIIRQSRVYIESAQLGRVTIGQQSTATDGIAEISLGSGVGVDSQVGIYNSAFFLRATPGGAFSTITWGNLVSNLDGPRENTVRYDSPSIYGFILSAAWGDDDFWDASLRFSKEWNSIRIAAGIGYQEDRRTGTDIDIISGSVSVMHTPSGIFGTFAAGEQDVNDGSGTGVGDGAYYWSLQLGVQRNFTGLGATTIAGLYGNYVDFGFGRDASSFGAQPPLGGTPIADNFISSSDVDRWQFVLNQRFDSAALDVYLNVDYYEADLKIDNPGTPPGPGVPVSQSTSDWYGIVTGLRMQF